jgi:hypothetical protein
MITKQLNLVDLDFDSLKADLIAYFQGKPQWKDYDFTGSNLNVLMEIMAYNANKHAFLTNMLLSEAFLDSAQLPSSVYSHCKDLNYLPRSIRSSQAQINCTFTATGLSQPYIIPKGSVFSTQVRNTTYNFTTAETTTVASANTTFNFQPFIYEGVYLQDVYTYNVTETNPYPRFAITNPNVDTTSLVVAVYNDDSNNAVDFALTTSLLDLNDQSLVFFLQPSETGGYEVMFGDGIVGLQPLQGATIVLQYRVTVGDRSNGSQNFAIGFDPTGRAGELTSAPVVRTLQAAAGGAPKETLDSVRFYAPRYFQTQERAIVPTDYEVLLKIQFPEINAVSAFGGESAIPPQFGYVLVSIDLPGFTTLPATKQTEYTAFLKGRMPMSIEPVFIDPVDIFTQVNATVRYNINITTNTPSLMQSIVATAILGYNQSTLNNFNVTLKGSQLEQAILDADPSISSVNMGINLYQSFVPATGATTTFNLKFGVPLQNNYSPLPGVHPANLLKCLSSTQFYNSGTLVSLEDDGLGNVNMVTTLDNIVTVLNRVGIINYQTGQVVFTIQIDNFVGNAFLIFVQPLDTDISVTQNNILKIDPSQINLTIQQVDS